MGFKDLLEQSVTRTEKCKVAYIIDQLTGQDKTEANEVIQRGSGYSGATIANALKTSTGISVSASAVNNHRNGECPCPSQMR